MSYVTNVLLAIDIMEDEREEGEHIVYPVVEQLNLWLEKKVRRGFVQLEEEVGGTKFLEHPTFCAAFNHLPLDEFLDKVRSLPWRHPENLQVFVCDQNDDRYTLLIDGESEATQ